MASPTARRSSRSKSSSRSTKSDAPVGPITNYTTALKWLYTHVDYERMRVVPYNTKTFNLERMRKLLELLGDPHKKVKCVQVAGTKGKGSTCTMLAHMMQSCGYAVGLYTSPHLVDLRERVVINGEIISYADAAEVMRQIQEIEPKLPSEPSYFEILTAVALRHFADQAVDVAVLETGLGGRLDCVSVVDPLVTGITQISIDHANILGSTVEKIAEEKAGVFKKNVPAISCAQTPEVAAVLRAAAEKTGCEMLFTGDEIDFSYRFESNRELGPHTRVCLTTERGRYEHLAVPLRGEHQALNCGLAIAMLDQLTMHGFTLPEDKVIEGLATTTLPGRMERVHEEPRVMIDGAHNAVSIQALIRALGAHIAYDSLVMIFGTGQDKDVPGMLAQIALGADKVIFTRAKNNPRAMEPIDLLNQFNEVAGKMAQTADDLEEALQLAGRAVSREDLIIVTGSFYLAGECKKLFAETDAKRRKERERG